MGKDTGNRTSNRCRWLHNWGKWEFVEEIPTYEGNRHTGVITKQFRKCDRCGYTQTRLDTVRA